MKNRLDLLHTQVQVLVHIGILDYYTNYMDTTYYILQVQGTQTKQKHLPHIYTEKTLPPDKNT